MYSLFLFLLLLLGGGMHGSVGGELGLVEVLAGSWDQWQCWRGVGISGSAGWSSDQPI